jgi:hypothetical protein
MCGTAAKSRSNLENFWLSILLIIFNSTLSQIDSWLLNEFLMALPACRLPAYSLPSAFASRL